MRLDSLRVTSELPWGSITSVIEYLMSTPLIAAPFSLPSLTKLWRLLQPSFVFTVQWLRYSCHHVKDCARAFVKVHRAQLITRAVGIPSAS